MIDPCPTRAVPRCGNSQRLMEARVRAQPLPSSLMRRLLTTTLAAGLLASALTAPAAADPSDAADLDDANVVPIQVTGDDDNRFTMVVLGDGYTEEELPTFREEVEHHMNVMWSIEPFRSYRNYVNVYAIEIPSAESGVSCDPDLDSPQVDTPLGMGFWGGCNPDSVQRLLTVDGDATQQYAELAPDVDQILALGNSDTYGGAGGQHATASGGNALSALITPHELAHSFGDLQDEYDYYARGVTTGDYTGPEPDSIHHTVLTEEEMRDQQVKWWRWLGEESESGGTIGRHEGGMYYSTGIYRPSRHSMMKVLGFYFDQVSREQMTAGISGTVDLIESATDTSEQVGRTDVLWVETTQPAYHDLDISWTLNGEPVEGAAGQPELDLADANAEAGDQVEVTVVDPTDFVRDPELRSSEAMTTTREWTVQGNRSRRERVDPEITGHTPNESPVGGKTTLSIHTTHAVDRAFDVTWWLDGEQLSDAADDRALDLDELELAEGTHEVRAEVSDPWAARSATDEVTWTVDNAPATVEPVLSEPLDVVEEPGEPPHYTFSESFTMDLQTQDDQDGHVVAEFRLNGDGWHHFYGWPTDPDEPFLFTPMGTNVDDLIYGNLGTGGLSLSPFQEREPGYGTHRIEYRTIDAAGNISPAEEFMVTVVEE